MSSHHLDPSVGDLAPWTLTDQPKPGRFLGTFEVRRLTFSWWKTSILPGTQGSVFHNGRLTIRRPPTESGTIRFTQLIHR
ncbi:hypothetical protein SprV_1002820200 [Sparganum proliferum]